MPKILKAFDPFSYKTTQSANRKRVITAGGTTASPVEKSWHDPSMLVGRVTRRVKVRRLHVNDPYNALSTSTVARFSPEADQLTNNPNPKFDPSKAPGAVSQVSRIPATTAANKPGKASRGHGNVIRRTLFNQNAGKTLRRR